MSLFAAHRHPQALAVIVYTLALAHLHNTTQTTHDPSPSPSPSPSHTQVTCPSLRLTDTLRLSPSDKTITVRVFVDNVMAEVYWQNGRVVMTLPLRCGTPGCAMAVRADQPGVTLASATAWAVKSVWVSAEQVLNTPRRDGGDVELMKQRIRAQQTL